MIDSKLRARLSRHSTLRRLAAGEPLSVHPDYQPAGIAPRMGHMLKVLSEDPKASSTIQGLATAIRHNGAHEHLPILADALEEEGHPAFEQFDWRHAPRAIEIDKALETEIGRHRIRQINPDTGRRENRPLSPGWVLADWKEKTRGRVPLRRAVEIVRQRVPDATRADVVHSALRLTTNHNSYRPYVAQKEEMLRRGRETGQVGRYSDHEEGQVRPEHVEDAVNVYMGVEPWTTNYTGHSAEIDKANASMLGVPNGDRAHEYPDTRLSRRRLSRFRDAVRRLAAKQWWSDDYVDHQPYSVVEEDQPKSKKPQGPSRSRPSAPSRPPQRPAPVMATGVSPPVARRLPAATITPKAKTIPTAGPPVPRTPQSPAADPLVAYHVTYRHKDGGTKSKVVFSSKGAGQIRGVTKLLGHFPLTVREATGDDLQKNPGASTRVKFARGQGETPDRMALGNPDHEAFLHKIAQNPEDDHSSLVFADWLEENGHENSAKVIRGQHQIEGHAKPITWRSTNFPHIADRPFQLHAMVENPHAEDGEGSPLADVDLYFGHEHPIGNQNKMYGWTYSLPHKDVPDLMRGLADEGVHGAEDEWNHMEGLNETPERESAYRAPAGGAIVRGIYYKGGKMMPDLQKFARAFAPKKLALDEDGDWYDNETPLEHDPAPSFTVHTKDGQEVPIHGSREDGDHGHDYTFVGHLDGQEVPVASMTVHRKGPTAKFKVQLPREHRKSGIVEAVRHHADQIAHTHGASLGKPDREELEDHEDAPVREAEFVEPSRPDARTPPRGYSFAFANERYW